LQQQNKKKANFVSVDLKVKTPDFVDDEVIKEFIDLVDNRNTKLVISDSRVFRPREKLDFIFIDGDHSYEGVKGDYNHYEKYLNNGCEIMFHDAVSSRPYSTKHDEVNQFMFELKDNKKLKFIKDVGSIRHFRYIGD
jgi:predicted O-methyltransferase YrrM